MSMKRWIVPAKRANLCMATRTRRTYSSFTTGKRNLVNHGGMQAAMDFWLPLPELVQRTKNPNRTHIIFLEGPSGSGKRDVLWRLEKMSLSTINLPFIELAKREWHQVPNLEQLNMKWIEQLTSQIQTKYPQKHKSNILVVNRSPVSMWAHLGTTAAAQIRDQFFQWKREHNVSVLLCVSDSIRRQERIGERSARAQDNEIPLRHMLGELSNGDFISSEIQLETAKRYEELHMAGLFDSTLSTTSAKQATAQLLKISGVEFESITPSGARDVSALGSRI